MVNVWLLRGYFQIPNTNEIPTKQFLQANRITHKPFPTVLHHRRFDSFLNVAHRRHHLLATLSAQKNMTKRKVNLAHIQLLKWWQLIVFITSITWKIRKQYQFLIVFTYYFCLCCCPRRHSCCCCGRGYRVHLYTLDSRSAVVESANLCNKPKPVIIRGIGTIRRKDMKSRQTSAA